MPSCISKSQNSQNNENIQKRAWEWMESIEISLNGAELQGALGKIVRSVGPWYKYILPSYFLTLFKKKQGGGNFKAAESSKWNFRKQHFPSPPRDGAGASLLPCPKLAMSLILLLKPTIHSGKCNSVELSHQTLTLFSETIIWGLLKFKAFLALFLSPSLQSTLNSKPIPQVS